MATAAQTLKVKISAWRGIFGCVVGAVIVPFLGWTGWTLLRDAGPGFSKEAVYGVVFMLFVPLLLLPMLWLVRAALTGETIVTIDKNGVFDIRLTDRPIPWTAISGVIVYRRARTTYLGLRFDQGLVESAEAFGAPDFWLFRLNRFAARLRNRLELSINLTLLDASASTIVSAMQAHKPGLLLQQEA